MSYACLIQGASCFDGLSSLVAVEVATILSQMDRRVLIKWPNDFVLPLQGRSVSLLSAKVGGILIESVRMGERVRLVVGLGLNLNEHHPAFIDVSLSGKQWLLSEISSGVALVVDRYNQGKAPLINPSVFQQFDVLYNKKIAFTSAVFLGDKSIVGGLDVANSNSFSESDSEYRYHMLAKGISDRGELVVLNEETSEKFYLKNAYDIALID